jgi:hypothetical protein
MKTMIKVHVKQSYALKVLEKGNLIPRECTSKNISSELLEKWMLRVMTHAIISSSPTPAP